ncbi:hypothetical protein [Ferroglobus placidus]|uniref:hypothetical protein n=1 Tax=Ferroglobus placidus TaxID=54261 RepID=UPI0011D04021|nr:hypothetical protein [Ferroglobus placidus]
MQGLSRQRVKRIVWILIAAGLIDSAYLLYINILNTCSFNVCSLSPLPPQYLSTCQLFLVCCGSPSPCPSSAKRCREFCWKRGGLAELLEPLSSGPTPS